MNSIQVRPAKSDDFSFIYATWLRSYRHDSQFARRISNEIYFHWHHRVIDRIIERGGQILVATPIDEPGVILGYVCIERQPDDHNVVHYCYVKRTFRKLGIARELLNSTDLNKALFTHWTSEMDWALKRHPNLKYDPYRL